MAMEEAVLTGRTGSPPALRAPLHQAERLGHRNSSLVNLEASHPVRPHRSRPFACQGGDHATGFTEPWAAKSQLPEISSHRVPLKTGTLRKGQVVATDADTIAAKRDQVAADDARHGRSRTRRR
jgi:hypothetical protein